jgi:DNA-directed RNA polymerase omega subunit
MRVVTPGQAARHTGSKYLGVLVAAKMARNLNELRRNELMEDPTLTNPDEVREKLTTVAIEEVRDGKAQYTLVRRRRVGDELAP